MRILVVDGALARASAAVWADGCILARAGVDVARGQPTLLPGLAQQVLRQAGMKAEALDAVAAVVGPGGFTGLRAALALAQGLALAIGRPAIGVTSGEALAAGLSPAQRQGREVWTCVDTRRGRLLLERFAPGAETAMGPPQSLAPEELPEGVVPLLAGDAVEMALAALAARGVAAEDSGHRLPDAADAAAVAALRLAGRLPPLPALPLYVEPPAVRVPPQA
ncbi:tRNA (adenosine(37)-N6)-threonylcarbamoyltransferase complex dimerization subunit type 1 TsaB [Roseomonas marmotae]|uniref:tRNA (Adenosine(37)-N6)-threonylcarbamoyltransferase complex dimerization subunit type 1 TsaB n=1 Tax=Roseomonas marmotae TaxID=2768161 RepID=A0ABS3K716_9PROT|nr:tRNA (adenosine(37)-N6)-threonylcarbamoyltransferase complex dimerization subunit type 1 TsaB [Roseomonas marmotae]MBO1073255.1 tRNA (adenosine(37)-N6)-threonylcarbamoyltransferase complex dimerization subunit type 1 TsaB [Roseomonas marmotae]QTI79121.1 tRNA (adenosine(37)-N6)-threonylcarbamoyltransferase complex dimerization subunit type 1 TsaB [Roseomonas marmotae]